MSKTTDELRRELRDTLKTLQTLGDEVRARLHLGGAQAKDEWNRLEPHIADIEKKASDLSDASRSALTDALQSLKKLRASLAEGGER